ncbi:Peptidase A31, hydrogenase expression/formation protein, partial [sediment metagenome]
MAIETLVLGIGNVLWADEGFGVRAVAALDDGWQFPESVTLMDGGTQGLYLLPYVQAARRMLVFDAIDYRLEPGTLQVIRDDDIPSYLGIGKMSLHQSSFQEVLSLAKLSGQAPEHAVLVGVQPAVLMDFRRKPHRHRAREAAGRPPHRPRNAGAMGCRGNAPAGRLRRRAFRSESR